MLVKIDTPHEFLRYFQYFHPFLALAFKYLKIFKPNIVFQTNINFNFIPHMGFSDFP